MVRNKALITFTILSAAFLAAYVAYAGVTGSKHDISIPGYSPCIYCHTPHSSNTAINAPLWNKSITNVTYTTYSSPTMDTVPSNPPSGISLACLSCHDGVMDDAHNMMHAPGGDINNVNCSQCHSGPIGGDSTHSSAGIPFSFYIGKNLSNDHPISMDYPTAAQDAAFNPPAFVQTNGLRLFSNKVECASCHEPHDPTNTPFLRKSNAGSALCLTCHIK